MIGPGSGGMAAVPDVPRLPAAPADDGARLARASVWIRGATTTGRSAWPISPEKEIAAYAGPTGELTFVGLDTRAQYLNVASPETPAYSIGGLPPSTTFNLAIWNATANGENAVSGTVTTSGAGVARFDVPLHGAFALTTVPMS